MEPDGGNESNKKTGGKKNGHLPWEQLTSSVRSMQLKEITNGTGPIVMQQEQRG